jgi:uracil-DNA glycosylase
MSKMGKLSDATPLVLQDISIFEETPWNRNDEASWTFRESRVGLARIASLTTLIEALRKETNRHVPWIDPFCGGIEAKILLVLLRPGPRGAMASNFLSLANSDATAKNMVQVVTEAGIRYRELTFWNAIPWSGPREEKITSAMLERGAGMLARLIPLLPTLKAVILIGREAQRLEPSMPNEPSIQVFRCAHPGPFVWNQHRYRPLKQGIFDAFRSAATLLHEPA